MSEKDELRASVQTALNAMGPLFGSRVIVATYQRGEKTPGGVYLIDQTRKEDIYQGKIGLIVKLGMHAFKDREFWDNDPPQEGDWVVFNIQDTRGLALVDPTKVATATAKVECRIMDDTAIQCVVEDPRVVY